MKTINKNTSNFRKEYKLPTDKFVILETHYYNNRACIKMSVINKNEFVEVSYDLYWMQIMDILVKLEGEYSKIFIRGINYYVLQDYLDLHLLKFKYSIHRMDNYVSDFLKENRRLDLLGVR